MCLLSEGQGYYFSSHIDHPTLLPRSHHRQVLFLAVCFWLGTPLQVAKSNSTTRQKPVQNRTTVPYNGCASGVKGLLGGREPLKTDFSPYNGCATKKNTIRRGKQTSAASSPQTASLQGKRKGRWWGWRVKPRVRRWWVCVFCVTPLLSPFRTLLPPPPPLVTTLPRAHGSC